MLPCALLLDLDDTLIQYDVIADACWREACETCLPPEFPVRQEEVLAGIQRYRDWYYSDPERHRQGRFALDRTRLNIVSHALAGLGCDTGPAGTIANAYKQLRNDRVALFPGTAAALERLRTHVQRMALVTNGEGEGQRAKIERFDLGGYFDYICIEGEVGWGKPDERVYQRVLEELGADAEQSWMVGDNLEWDVAAPQRLGMTGVWVDVWSAGLPPNCSVRPDRIIGKLAELV